MANPRTCIKCDEDLRVELLEEVEVDICPGCGGMWLDKGEIRELAAKLDLDDLDDEKDSEAAAEAPHDAHDALDTPCPACGSKLSLAHFPGYAVEHCTTCEGIFLDAGELKKAMETVGQKGAAATIVALARSVTTRGRIGDA